MLGISNTAVTPPMTAPREPVSRSSLWVSAGLAEMHLGVDHARQHMQPAAVDHLAGRSRRQVADRGDAAAGDGEVAHAFAVVIDDGGALEDQVVALGHSNRAALVTVAASALRLACDIWQVPVKHRA